MTSCVNHVSIIANIRQLMGESASQSRFKSRISSRPTYTAKGTQQFHTDTWLVTQPSTKNTNNSSWSQGYIPSWKYHFAPEKTLGLEDVISFLGRPPGGAMLVLGRVLFIVRFILSNLIILTPQTRQVTGVFFWSRWDTCRPTTWA